MAYIFDPIRNTFIDDEDKSLGNKLALLDPDLENAIRQIGEKFGPDTIKTLDQLPENKPAEVEETEAFNRFNRSYEDGGFIGGGIIAGEDYGDRTGFAKPGAKQRLGKPNKPINSPFRIFSIPGGGKAKVITKEEFIKQYTKFLESDVVNKSDSNFAKILNSQGFTTNEGKPLGDAAVFNRRRRYGIEAVVESAKPSPDVLKKIKNVNEYLSDLVPELNAQNKYYTNEEVQSMVKKHFKKPNMSVDKRYHPILKQLFTRDEKVEELLKKMLISDKPLGTSFMRYISKEIGAGDRGGKKKGLDYKIIQRALKNSPTYKVIKDQGADLLLKRYYNNKELFDLPFADQLTKALDLAQGQPVFTGLGKEKYYSTSPKHKVMDFAKRSWNAGQGDGPVKFFNSKGDEIVWKRGLKLPYRNISFKYKGKSYDMSKLDNIDFLKKNFPEVYKKQTAVNRLRAVEVDNPFKKGTPISLLDLVKENSRQIYGWRSKRNTFDILHGINGVAVEPFTNLSFNSRDVNQMQLGLNTSVKAGKITQEDANKIYSFIDEYTGSGDAEKIKQRQISLTNDFLAGKVDSYGAERNRILSAAKKIPAIKKYAASQGITLNSFAGFLDFSQAGLELPPAIKQATDDILKIGGQVLRAGGKAAIVLDPMFAATDISEAFSKGASGKQAVNYAVGRFAEGVANLPDLIASGAKFGFDKARGKDTEFKTGALYEPFTFAQDKLSKTLEETPKEVLEARKAQLEFDQNVRPGMTMVDDTEIPASKAEIEAAKEEFMKEKGVDLSVLDNIEEEKPELLDTIKSLVAPDQTLNQFLANGGRVGFENGGAVGADDDFAKELEYYFLNEDAELPKATSYRETMNPVEALNDMIDPRNYPYYADLLVRSGLRVGEFGVRILPALGKLTSDLLTKPAFRVTGTKKTGYVQDYEDIPGTGVGLAEGLKLEGTGIFSDFLKNITPTSLEKKVGLDKLIEAEEQKQKDRRSTIAPKVLGETISLGAEVTAPVFPGLRLLRAFAADRKLPVDDVTRDIMEKEIDEALDARGISRRDFMKVAGAGGAVMVAKMLGVNLAKAPKVVKEVVKTGDVAGKPAWFDALVNRVIAEGDDVTKQFATQDRQIVHKVKLNETDEVTVYQNLDDGQIDVIYDSPTNMGEQSVNLTYKPGMMDETTGGKKPRDEFEATEVEPRYVGGPEDADIEFDGIGGGSDIRMLESDITPLKEFAGETVTTKDLLESIKTNKRVEAINTDTMEQAEYIAGKYGDGPEPDIDDFID